MSSRVNAALSAVKPMVTNYFRGILEGLVGCLSLTPPPGERTARSTQDGVERHVAAALQKYSLSNVPQRSLQLSGLHVGYSHGFAKRNVRASIPALSSTALPDLLQTMDCLHLSMPPVPETLRPLKTKEDLFD